jgi:hypothetical protein
VLLYCFHYDATLGKYSASVMTFVRAGGVLTMLSIAAFVWMLVRRGRPSTPPPEADDSPPLVKPAGGLLT